MRTQEIIVPTTSRSPIKARKARKALRYHLKAVSRRYSRSLNNFSILETITFSGEEPNHGG